MKIFVTGATGFIGKNLTKRLLELGHDVTCGVRSFKKLGSLHDRVKKVHLQLEDREKIFDTLASESPDVVYHCAALVESNFLPRLRWVNALGTQNVLEACLAARVRSVIYLSSVAVIAGNTQTPLTEDLPYKPTNPYGRSKVEAEKIALECREKGLNIAILRPCMVYGKGEPHLLKLLGRLLKWRLLPIFGSGENKLHLVSVDNVVDVMILCLGKPEAYEGTYVLADKKALNTKEVLNYLAKVLAAKPPLVVPENITKILTKIPLAGGFVRQFTKDRHYSIDRLKEKFGYIPRVSVYDGLKKAILSYDL
jgi:UDP-glucose 4-epimerase